MILQTMIYVGTPPDVHQNKNIIIMPRVTAIILTTKIVYLAIYPQVRG